MLIISNLTHTEGGRCLLIRPTIYLITKSDAKDNDDPFNHTKQLSFKKYNGARVTELNGAQEQINVFGQQYDKSWVIRCNGHLKADYIGISPEFNEKTMEPKYQIKQSRSHNHRTTFYVVRTSAK